MTRCAMCGKFFDSEEDKSLVYCGSCMRDLEELLVGRARVES